MKINNEKEIYFHVGLAKTGSTFLQERVFKHLKNIHYIDTSKYKKIDQLISESKHQRILVSREFDRQFKKEVDKFSEKYPNATPVMVLREHHSYIASQYRRAIKNGSQKTLKNL